MDHNPQIQAAIADLELQDHQNIAATAKNGGSRVKRCQNAFEAKQAQIKTQTRTPADSSSLSKVSI
jgi:hypothetical protein